MLQARIDFFARLTKEEKETLKPSDFIVSEFKEIVSETALTEMDRLIILYRHIDCMTHEQIAEKVGIDIRTCTKRIPKIEAKIKNTYLKLFYRWD